MVFLTHTELRCTVNHTSDLVPHILISALELQDRVRFLYPKTWAEYAKISPSLCRHVGEGKERDPPLSRSTRWQSTSMPPPPPPHNNIVRCQHLTLLSFQINWLRPYTEDNIFCYKVFPFSVSACIWETHKNESILCHRSCVTVHVGCFRRVGVDGVERTGMWEPREIEYGTG